MYLWFLCSLTVIRFVLHNCAWRQVENCANGVPAQISIQLPQTHGAMQNTHLICSRTFISSSKRFHTEIISSLCLTLIVQPQISGQSPPSTSPSPVEFPSRSALDLPRPHSSKRSPTTPHIRSSHIRSATPFRRRMIHLPPVRFRGSSHTGRRMPAWNKR